MRTLLVTGSDTGIGKTRAVAALIRFFTERGGRVQVVKPVETGRAEGEQGDAAAAVKLSGAAAAAITLERLLAPLAPAAAAAREGRPISVGALAGKLEALPAAEWRIVEGAGGIASPLDETGLDWADFASAIRADAVVVVVPDRLGAINQARLACGRAAATGLRFGVWLNTLSAVEPEVAESNRQGIRAAGLELWAEQAEGGARADVTAEGTEALTGLPNASEVRRPGPRSDHGAPAASSWLDRCRGELAERDRKSIRRRLRVASPRPSDLNLADNDYLELAEDPAVIAAASGEAARRSSASAAPLISGWREPHERLVRELTAWHGIGHGLLWSSGYAANSAVLGTLPRRGDLILADRLIHHSLIAGALRSGAQVRRYAHLDLDQLERLLREGNAAGRQVFVVTESVYSMDGDYPDLGRLAELRRAFGFCWMLDEAHGVGWYGPQGAGLARRAGVQGEVDVLVGTLGKALASGGAYTLFQEEAARDHLVNFAGEFVYSTSLPPANAAAAGAAVRRIRELAADQPIWQAASRDFRARLRAAGWNAPEGDSPILPVRLDDEESAVSLAAALRAAGIWVGAVRPPTVPVGTSRLRISIKRSFGSGDAERVLAAMEAWRRAR